VLSFFTNFFSILPFTQDYAEIDNSKSPYLPSFVLLHSEIDPVVKNVIDFVFLHGYLQPTLAILFQSKQTCAGRLGVLKDSVSVVVVSIDVTQKKYPLLYRVDELPYNSNRIIAVPKPLGGLLILGHNSLIYIDQTSNPGLCCILNGYFDGETELKSSTAVVDAAELLPLKPKPPSKFVKLGKVCDYRNLGIALDGASCIFLTPDILLLILRDGEMFQVDLIGDDGIGRSWKRRRGGVKKIEISKIGLRTIKASCLVSIHDFAGNLTANSHTWTDESGSTYVSSYFFIGSKVNDCLLVEYSECLEQSKSVASGQQTADFDDDLDLDLYGNSNFPIQENATFYKKTMIKYRVCDSLMVVGPMRDIAIGKIAYYSSHNFQSDGSPGYDLEVVACTGDGYDGSLTALHNSLRPKILSSFELKDVQDIWSISSSNFHKYVFLSRTNGTAVY
jgi:cleavage and polyadenylation specificity factor subunit 1